MWKPHAHRGRERLYGPLVHPGVMHTIRIKNTGHNEGETVGKSEREKKRTKKEEKRVDDAV